MRLSTFRDLLAPGGQALLQEAAALAPTEATLLACLDRLRRGAPPELAAAAVEQVLLRARAAASGKFSRAAAMYFTRDGLEQATGEPLAQYRAERYAPYGDLADLGAGIGGDALALAGSHRVLAFDRDLLRLAMARENAKAYGVDARLLPVLADLNEVAPPRVGALFCDPGRRTAAGRRVRTTRDYEPPLATLDAWRARVPALGVKVSPGIDYAELPPPDRAEVEFVSERGALKETVLWYGPLRTAARRATLLPSRATLMTAGEPLPAVPISPPGKFLYEPDRAVIRAHLVELLAPHLKAWKLDRDIAYLTSDALVATPFARAYPVLESLPFSLKALVKKVREYDAGVVTVKKRGSPLDTEALARTLRGTGTRPLTVVLTHLLGRPYALICVALPATNGGSATPRFTLS